MKNLAIFIVVVCVSSFGYALIPNEQQLTSNILRGGRPELSDLDELKLKGYRTIINLENDELAVASEKDYAEKLGFNYISSPMNPAQRPNDGEIDKLLFALQNAGNEPIFIHCKHGRDRTGLLSGLYRVFVQKWSSERAYQEMLDLGFRPIFSNLKKYFFDKTKDQ